MSRIHDAPPSGHLEPLQFDKFVYDPQALKFDEVNTGLQRDHGPEAPEAIIVRDGIDAPETVVESGLEMPLSEPPILAEVPKFLKSERDSSDTIGARPQSRRRARSAAVILILLTLAGLAIGLGLGLTRSSPTSGAAQTNLGGNSSNSSNISPSAPALISENSALAAGTLENGDRVLFFQDSEQRLRKAAYSGDSWKLLEDISSTMLATISPSSSLSLDIVHTSSDLSMLFYFDKSNTVNFATSLNSYTWNQTGEMDNYVINATAGFDPSHICSATSLRSDNQTLDTFLVLWNAHSEVTILQSTFTIPDLVANRSKWVDRTQDLYQCSPRYRYSFSLVLSLGCASAPIHEQLHPNTDADGVIFYANFYDETGDIDNTVIEVGYNITNEQFFCSSSAFNYDNLPTLPNFTDQSESILTIQPDLSKDGFWINGTMLSKYMASNSLAAPPPVVQILNGEFAVLKSSSGAGPLYFYYQLNQTAFVESFYDPAIGAWNSTEVNLPFLVNAS